MAATASSANQLASKRTIAPGINLSKAHYRGGQRVGIWRRCELIESTHIALAADTATFSKAEINIGIIPTFGGTQRLPRNVGRKTAIELILTGRTFDATEAVHLGLVNRVVPSANLLDEALTLANLLATKAPLTLAAALGA